MSVVKTLQARVMAGELLGREEALQLIDAPLKELTEAADEIRKHFCGNRFDLCAVVNGKCGRCSEDCKFCAQNLRAKTKLEAPHPLLDADALVAGARRDYEQGILRYSIVTSGRRLSKAEVDQICVAIRRIRQEVGIQVCVSFGLLDEEAFRKLKEAGASRVHCNLESSARYFSELCTTHTYQEKIETLKAAARAGLDICSGGIMGLGETMEDRIDLVLTARELGVKSIPVNLLKPIPGTAFEKNRVLSNEEMCRIVAIFRFLIPDAMIRLAGGRGLVGDQGVACFESGANAAISGDMLTISGITTATDLKILGKLGYEVRLPEQR